jgi:hypothetical protein
MLNDAEEPNTQNRPFYLTERLGHILSRSAHGLNQKSATSERLSYRKCTRLAISIHTRAVNRLVPILLPIPRQTRQKRAERARQRHRRDPAAQAEPRRVERAQCPQRPPRPRLQVQHQQAAGGPQARHPLAHHRQWYRKL